MSDSPVERVAAQLEELLSARRRARRWRAFLMLGAAFSAFAAVILPAPASWGLYAVAVASLVGAVVFLVKSGRVKREAAAVAVELHNLDPYLDVLLSLPKPVASVAGSLMEVRKHEGRVDA